MSAANIKFLKTCSFCNREFLAQKVITRYCCHNCARKAYKLKIRQQNIEVTQVTNELQSGRGLILTEEQTRVMQAKELLTLKEAAVFLNISPLTLRRWTLAGKLISSKIGRKHVFRKSIIMEKLTSVVT